jgi:hypothetical protein
MISSATDSKMSSSAEKFIQHVQVSWIHGVCFISICGVSFIPGCIGIISSTGYPVAEDMSQNTTAALLLSAEIFDTYK